MTEQEYEKLVRAVSNKYMADVFPCNPVAPASFEAGVKWTRENPGPEVQALVDALGSVKDADSWGDACYMAKIALARFKERTAGKGEG